MHSIIMYIDVETAVPSVKLHSPSTIAPLVPLFQSFCCPAIGNGVVGMTLHQTSVWNLRNVLKTYQQCKQKVRVSNVHVHACQNRGQATTQAKLEPLSCELHNSFSLVLSSSA